VNGALGTAAGPTPPTPKVYPYNSPGFGSDTQCAQGTVSGGGFPTPGNTSSWTCLGSPSGVGTNSGIGQAYQNAAPSLIATPQTIPKGASSKLTWTSTAATCTGPFDGATNLNPSNLANSTGSGVSVTPTTTTTYSITCSDGGVSSAPITVTVKIKPKFQEK